MSHHTPLFLLRINGVASTMTTQTKLTRTVKKLEVPRPLRAATSSAHNRNSDVDVKINTIEDLLNLTETVAYEMLHNKYDSALQSRIATMYSNLKLYGAQLEPAFKELLDRSFVEFRNGSQEERLDKKTRLHLLELIELRAKNWQSSDFMSQYYRYRSTHAEPLLVPTMEGAGCGAGGSASPTLAAPAEPPALLAPGELIKPSGKFPKPTKIPGKNYSKDEVVIRNADSGKVMGIKGRRVHMIEELSDTIISFQRVSPGAKERLVQITGPTEENVNHAKLLIGDTIRRNASPVRLDGAMDGGPMAGPSRASLDSNGSDERPREKSPNLRPLRHSYSTNDAALTEYMHTVTFGEHSIKITGTNYDLVKTAKLALEEYFDTSNALEAIAAGAGAGAVERLEALGSGNGAFFTLSQRPEAALLLQDDALNGADDDVFVASAPNSLDGQPAPEGEAAPRRPRFSRATSTDKSSAGAGTRQVYSYETLMWYADSPQSKLPPADHARYPPELARKHCMEFDSATYLKKARAAGGVTIAQDVPDSPEPE